jgi:hypothetical protein
MAGAVTIVETERSDDLVRFSAQSDVLAMKTASNARNVEFNLI